MSSDLAIRFEGLAKSYRVGAAGSSGRYSYQSLGDRLSGALRNPFRAARQSLQRQASDSFWALQDISFDVGRGEVVGVIGRNGAGKSTLLKVLSQITCPTTGHIEVHGRVGSLLEVGTGFHPELTGRENIFLNGAILGMTQREVRAKFDEIVAFSGVERFLDTPVKQYSSGMYTRLAFAVAAHLEPEILVVDEVLAVGDAEFQRKCLGKMQDVASGGRTVLFVSHNMNAVRKLCSNAVLLERGCIVEAGETAEVLTRYLETDVQGDETAWRLLSPNLKSVRSYVSFVTAEVEDSLHIDIDLVTIRDLSRVGFSLIIRSQHDEIIARLMPGITSATLDLPAGQSRVTLTVPGVSHLLTSGEYWLSLGVHETGVCDLATCGHAGEYSIVARNRYGGSLEPMNRNHGWLQLPLNVRLCDRSDSH